MLQKKICMLGAFAVGKTSLVRRYVDSIFSDAYLTTVGVKIDKKSLNVQGRSVDLIVWDIAGEDDISAVRMSYVRGASGYLLVVDGTRPETLDVADSLRKRVASEIGSVPFVALLNKQDLRERWAISQRAVQEREQDGWLIQFTSAKTGAGVESAFQALADRVAG